MKLSVAIPLISSVVPVTTTREAGVFMFAIGVQELAALLSFSGSYMYTVHSIAACTVEKI